jgi:hypothetical protein
VEKVAARAIHENATFGGIRSRKIMKTVLTMRARSRARALIFYENGSMR